MAQSLIFEQLPREQSRHQMVVQRLHDAIGHGQLAVGEHLPSERELCEQLGVSRTIVREAIRVLTAQGILMVRQGRRAVVAADVRTVQLQPMRRLIQDAARETFGDVMDARLILEVASAERAAQKATAEDIAALSDALDALRTAPSHSAASSEAHASFHRAVALASHNLFLARMVESLLDFHVEDPAQISENQAMEMALLPVGFEAHARIFRPIRDHRMVAARRAMQEHLSSTIHHHPDLHR